MEKSLDNKGRWRNVTVAFRVSQSESDALNTKVRLSGLSKQEYLIRRVLCEDIVVIGNPRVYKALRNQVADIAEELKRLTCSGEINEELLDTIRLVAQTLGGLKGGDGQTD